MKPLERLSARHLVLIAVLCMASLSANAGEKLLVYTVNYPLQYFAGRIAGDYAQVEFPAPADVDPAFWMPDAETIRSYQRADLILLNGAGYAQWVDQVSLPHRRQVDTSASFAAVYIPEDATLTDSRGSGGGHAHTRMASTTWLDFFQAAQQAEAVMQALSRKRPQQRADFERNYAALKQELMALDLDMQRLVASQPDEPLFAAHPVYHYLARRYLLHLQSVTWEADVMPTDQAWEQLVLAQEAFPAEWMLWQDQPSAAISERLQSMGVGVAVFSPCGNRPPRGDFMTVMKRNLENLKSVFPEGGE